MDEVVRFLTSLGDCFGVPVFGNIVSGLDLSEIPIYRMITD